jgi:hypothetical protein
MEMLEQLEAAAVKCAATPAWPLSDADIADCLDVAHRLEQETAAIMLHLVQAAQTRGLAQGHGFRSTAGWLRYKLRLDPLIARTMVHQAAAINRHPEVDHALSCGSVDSRQAAAITEALDDLPADLDADITQDATSSLLNHANRLEAAQLRKIGSRILEHVAPEIADARDEAALAREERRAHRNRGLNFSLPTEGAVRVTGTLTTEAAAIVRAAIDPLCTPQPNDSRSPAQLRADALVEICRLALRTGELPDNGGEPPQITITIPFDPLTGALGRAYTDTGEYLPAEAARRLACDAQILPVVMGGKGQVLDAGRSRRLATGPLRRALVARDGGCAFPGCDRPPRWCDGHHIRHWADGGTTKLDNLVLLCGHHHRLLHQGDWVVQLGPDSRPEFIAPDDKITADGSNDAPRAQRNVFHRRT